MTQTRHLGTAGLVSSAIGLGTAAFTGIYGAVSERECRRVIEVALNGGITLLDTADFYADGENERLLGRAVAARRGRVLISTHGGVRSVGPPPVPDGRPEFLARACEASLRRLDTGHIDLYYLSRVDPRVPVEESVGKLADLVTAGKIRYVGLHEPSADDLRRAHATYPISAIAVQYSLRDRSAENRILSTAEELGIGVVAYCPLDRGRLTGRWPAPKGRERRALLAMEAEAAELDIGMARLALAWLSRCREVVPVPSSRSLADLEMNASAAYLRLSSGTCARLDRAFPS